MGQVWGPPSVSVYNYRDTNMTGFSEEIKKNMDMELDFYKAEDLKIFIDGEEKPLDQKLLLSELAAQVEKENSPTKPLIVKIKGKSSCSPSIQSLQTQYQCNFYLNSLRTHDCLVLGSSSL